MPSNHAIAREVRLVKAVSRWLREQGKTCVIVGWPDREHASWHSDLTVEAVFAIGAAPSTREWAVDVMTVPVPSNVSAGISEARAKILPGAAVLAEKAHRGVTISIRVPAGNSHIRDRYFANVLLMIENTLKSGEDYYDASGSDPETQVLISSNEFLSDPSGPLGAVRVHLMPFLSGRAGLSEELRSTLADPLARKLTSQLRRAKELGYPTLLLLDQIGHEALPAGVTWSPSQGGIETVVAECDAAHPNALDAVVLARSDGSIVQVFGKSF